MAFEHILFDLDGTLTNSYEGIAKCVQYALHYYGIEENNEENLKRFIGPPLWESFHIFYDFPEEKAKEAVLKYRERYNTVGVYENKVISGVPETLKTLYDNGKKIYLATSKPLKLAKIVLEHFDLAKYFTFICGASLDFSFEDKASIINYVLDNQHIENRSSALMIGDRKFDIIGAKQCGIKSVGVLCGFGSEDELKEYKADYIVPEFSDILSIIME